MNPVGSVERSECGRFWHIQCQPHVALRLKRVFAKLGDHARAVYSLADTPENARELEWFLERFPMTVSDAEHLRRRSAEHREQAQIVEDLLARRREIPPFDLALPAREYQREAAALALASGGLLLADDVGLGKTASAIAALTDPRTRPALVVTLTHLPEQWRREIAKFAPSLRTHVIAKGTPYVIGEGCAKRHRWVEDKYSAGWARCTRCGITRDDAHHGRAPSPDVYLCSYSKLAGWAETLAPVVKSVVYDEVQELRISGSAKYSGAQLVSDSVSFRTGLSATPIYNYGGEMYSILSLLRPDALGTRAEFVREWCTNDMEERKIRIKDPAAFGAYVRESGLMLRRTRRDVGRELPPKTRVPHHIDADLSKLDEVSRACADLAKFILGIAPDPNAGRKRTTDIAQARAAKLLASEELSNKLRQATGVAKAPFVAEFVKMLLESEEKIVVYAWHREVYRILQEQLAGANPVLYTGSETPAEKEKSKKRFVEGDARVLLISLRAGAGLDGLQHVCRTTVFAELDWSPGVHEQAEGRIERDGQKDPVFAYYLLADVGSDPIVADVLGLKEQQSRGVRDPNADVVTKLEVDPNHIKRLAANYLAQRGGVEAAPS